MSSDRRPKAHERHAELACFAALDMFDGSRTGETARSNFDNGLRLQAVWLNAAGDVALGAFEQLLVA